jgi:hypothetical protein
MQQSRIIIVTGLLAALVFSFSRCFHDNSSAANDPRGEQYAGAEACTGCHRNIAGSYAHSNHYKTSSGINSDSLKKLIAPSADRFYFTDTGYIGIEEKNSALFQTLFSNGQPSVSEKFDISFGSAEKAQTYGYWKENKLYQLPLTWYSSMHTWANSPGFPAGRAHFGRVIESRCFECHASYINKELVPSGPMAVTENLDRNSIVYGIDCERCHGPAAGHVAFHRENPAVTTPKYITSIKSLTREQQLDVCAVCHSGNDQSVQRSLFAFMPGDTLSHFYYPDFGSGKPAPDVHGKQVQLLASSKCFKNSQLTCTTCHNAHEPEGNKLAGFIAKCMSCHQDITHPAGIITSSEQNCISCHMPLQTSRTIYFNNGREATNIPYSIRTHRIAVYR